MAETRLALEDIINDLESRDWDCQEDQDNQDNSGPVLVTDKTRRGPDIDWIELGRFKDETGWQTSSQYAQLQGFRLRKPWQTR